MRKRALCKIFRCFEEIEKNDSDAFSKKSTQSKVRLAHSLHPPLVETYCSLEMPRAVFSDSRGSSTRCRNRLMQTNGRENKFTTGISSVLLFRFRLTKSIRHDLTEYIDMICLTD